MPVQTKSIGFVMAVTDCSAPAEYHPDQDRNRRTTMSEMVIGTGDRALGFFALIVAAAVIGGPFVLVLFAPLVMAS
jgi:hypothetical protein